MVKDGDNYSFDDITSVIVKRNSLQECFGYNELTANIKLNQKNFIDLPSEIIDAIYHREENIYLGEIKDTKGFVILPTSIQSIFKNDCLNFSK